MTLPINSNSDDGLQKIQKELIELVEISRRVASQRVNALMSATYWEIGRRIAEVDQQGAQRAGYGEAIIDQLAAGMTDRLGRGFSSTNLKQMRAFYLIWSFEHIRQTLSDELPNSLLYCIFQMIASNAPPPDYEIILFQSDDGEIHLECRFESDSFWLSRALMAKLYGVTTQTITQHIRSVYEEDELDQTATCKDYLQVQAEGTRQVKRKVSQYSLPIILAVGYRVSSTRGTQLRRWDYFDEMRETLSLELNCSHYNHLARIENPSTRAWYQQEAIQQGWSVRALGRQTSNRLSRQRCQGQRND